MTFTVTNWAIYEGGTTGRSTFAPSPRTKTLRADPGQAVGLVFYQVGVNKRLPGRGLLVLNEPGRDQSLGQCGKIIYFISKWVVFR